MKKIILLVSIFFLITLIFPKIVTAPGPTTHGYLVNWFLENSDSDIAKLCKNYRREFEAGATVSDIGIKFYTTEGGKNYKLLHNWQYVERCLENARAIPEKGISIDSQRCYCYGTGIGHYGPDYISHNEWQPSEIPKWQVPNIGIHPILEGVLETYIIDTYPEIYSRTQKELDILLPESPNYRPDLVELTKKSISSIDPESLIDTEQEIKWLAGKLGSFYESAYITPDVYRGLSAAISATGSNKNYMPWTEKMKDQMDYFAKNWATFNRKDFEPHGFTKLTIADRAVSAHVYGLIKIPTSEDFSSGLGIFLLSIVRLVILVGIPLLIIGLFVLVSMLL